MVYAQTRIAEFEVQSGSLHSLTLKYLWERRVSISLSSGLDSNTCICYSKKILNAKIEMYSYNTKYNVSALNNPKKV